MANNIDYSENLRIKYAKEKVLKDKFIKKKKELDLKIKKCDDNMKKIKEDIENLEIEKTIKAIKLKGYSLSFVQDAIESGFLDEVNNSNKDTEDINKEDE